MALKDQFLYPLYVTLLIPAVIFGVGLLAEQLGNLLTHLFAGIFGARIAFFIRNRLTFVGTVHHELSHALFALLSGAKVTKVELFHVRGNQLGCVEFRPRGNALARAVQLLLASIAPVVCGGISLCVILWFWRYRCSLTWHYALAGYLAVSIFLHMNMSTQDIKNAWKGLPLAMLVCYLLFFALNQFVFMEESICFLRPFG